MARRDVVNQRTVISVTGRVNRPARHHLRKPLDHAGRLSEPRNSLIEVTGDDGRIPLIQSVGEFFNLVATLEMLGPNSGNTTASSDVSARP